MDLPESLDDLPRTLLGFHVQLSRRPRPQDTTLEKRIARLEAHEDIARLLSQYAYAYDDGDIDAMVGIYADDCVMVNNHGTFDGVDSIRTNYIEAISARFHSFHHIADLMVATSDDLAHGWATGYLHNLAVRDGHPGGTMASFVFHVRRLDSAWKVVECRIVVTNQHSYGPPRIRHPVPSIARPTSSQTVADLIDG